MSTTLLLGFGLYLVAVLFASLAFAGVRYFHRGTTPSALARYQVARGSLRILHGLALVALGITLYMGQAFILFLVLLVPIIFAHVRLHALRRELVGAEGG